MTGRQKRCGGVSSAWNACVQEVSRSPHLFIQMYVIYHARQSSHMPNSLPAVAGFVSEERPHVHPADVLVHGLRLLLVLLLLVLFDSGRLFWVFLFSALLVFLPLPTRMLAGLLLLLVLRRGVVTAAAAGAGRLRDPATRKVCWRWRWVRPWSVRSVPSSKKQTKEPEKKKQVSPTPQ